MRVSLSRSNMVLVLLLLLIASTMPACGTAPTTITPSPSPSLSLPPGNQVLVGAPTLTPIIQPTVPSTLPTPTSSLSSTEATPTKFAVAVASPTNPSPVKGPPPTVPPQPSVRTGKIAYTVVTGDAPKFHTIWLAGPDGSGQHQILTHAQWPALAPEGSRIAYLGTPEGGSRGLYIANADGSSPVLAVNDAGVCCLSWSHDGAWIVYAVSPRLNQPGGTLSKLKIDGAYKTVVSLGVIGNGPSFSPDNKQIVYSGSLPNQGTLGLMIASADGSGAHQITTDNGGNAQWSPRGDRIVYHANDGAGHRQIFVVNADGSSKKQLTNGKSNDGQPIWSRDGGSIFWRSDQDGKAWAIFVMNADGSNQRKLIDGVAPDPTFWGWESLSASQ